jgi:hypothetical protein
MGKRKRVDLLAAPEEFRLINCKMLPLEARVKWRFQSNC